MKKRIAGGLHLAVFILVASVAVAQPRPASIFTDNMVLQQKARVAIWGFADPSTTVKITPSWNKLTVAGTTDKDGNWKIWIETPAAGGPFTIRISNGKSTTLKNVMAGEVWLCSGQSNMEMPLKGFKGQPIIGSNEEIIRSGNPLLRLYTVPRSGQATPQENSKPSDWKEANPESSGNFSATAYYFGKLLYDILHVPIGLINCSYSTSEIECWMNANTLSSFPDIKIPGKADSIKVPFRTPTALYNGMLHPIVGYAIKGAIWYQGESNYDRPDQYELLLPAMVKEWRTEWQEGDFPFYYAQIAPFNYASLPPYNTGGKYNSAYLRDAQRKSLNTISNSGMAVLMDIGDEKTIHPMNKRVGGERLAWLTLGKTYERKGFAFESPEYDKMTVKDSIAEIKIKNAPQWLTSYGKELKEFEIAGKDKVFYPANATIYRNTVIVTSPQVKEPVAVRYAFKDYVKGELFSGEGLPVSSFRTDNW
jgi:sialate O-acetylesterase